MAEISAFDMILRAIYNWRIIIDSPEQLCLATQLADYYCALPILSSSLYAAFGRSFYFCSEIHGFEIELLGAAVKLRNDTLYKECMVLLMSPWTNPKFRKIQDPKLRQLANSAHHKLCQEVLEVQRNISEALYELPSAHLKEYRELDEEMTVEHLHDHGGKIVLPNLYRLMHDNLSRNLNHIQDHFGGLLENQLKLRSSWGRPGESSTWCEDYFLCLEIDDEELPWDINQPDW
jgi:hypothetical protein